MFTDVKGFRSVELRLWIYGRVVVDIFSYVVMFFFFCVAAGCGSSLGVWTVNDGIGWRDYILTSYLQASRVAAAGLICKLAVGNVKKEQFI